MGIGGPALFAHCKPTSGTAEVSFLVAEVRLSLFHGHVGIILCSFCTDLAFHLPSSDFLSLSCTLDQLWRLCPDGLLVLDPSGVSMFTEEAVPTITWLEVVPGPWWYTRLLLKLSSPVQSESFLEDSHCQIILELTPPFFPVVVLLLIKVRQLTGTDIGAVDGSIKETEEHPQIVSGCSQ